MIEKLMGDGAATCHTTCINSAGGLFGGIEVPRIDLADLDPS